MKRFSAILFIFIFLFASNVLADPQYTSGVTAQTLIDRIQYDINAVTDTFYTDADMLNWVNQGIVDIASRSKCLQGSYEKNLITDTYEYDLSGATNYMEINDVVYVDANARWVGLREATSMNLTQGMEDQPTFWYEDFLGSQILIFPTVSGVTGAPKVIIFYVARPTEITLTDEIPLPAKYNQALIYYVIAKALERDKITSSNMYNKYLESINNAMNNETTEKK